MRGQTAAQFGGFGRPGPITMRLLIALLVIYVVQLIALRTGMEGILFLYLQPNLVLGKGMIWQPFTSLWLHSPSDPSHLLFNGLWLYLFGTPLERWWGAKRYLWAYVIFGLGGAALTLFFGVLTYIDGIAALFGPLYRVQTLGASGAVIGLTTAWGLVHANERMRFFLLGEMTGLQFVYIIVGIQLLYALSFSAVSSTSHFGGIIAAWILCRGIWRPSAWKQWMRKGKLKKQRARVERELRILEGGRRDDDPKNWN
ncbi:MAG: rhomboid family intramembrane serine protease [Myxococcota bacterium]